MPTELRISGEDKIDIASLPKSVGLRWLGVYFNSRLLFIFYLEKIAAKNPLAANGLRMLTKII